MENELIKQKPKAIFFDLSSTILDSHAVDVEVIDSILTKYGLPKWSEGTRDKKEKEKSMKDNFPNFFGTKNAEKAYNEYLQYLLDNIEKMPLINNILQTLEYCKANEIKAIIVSNRDRKFVDVFLEKFKMHKYFDGIITPDDVGGITKPNPKILTSSFEKFDLNPKKDTLLFMGDAFADVKCAFRSGCIPILFTEIVRDEISPKNLERLKKLKPENPIREIRTQNEFIELLEESRKELWVDKPKTKITYIGAGGKIGQKAIQMICSKIPDGENVEIVLIGSGTEESLIRLNGYVKDLIGSLTLQGKKAKINFKITNDYSETRDSNIVLCSAGKWPAEADKIKYKEKDPSGRLVQSFLNAEMIKEITFNLQTHCPRVLLTIVTNQVDMMCHVARKIAPNMQIIGLTGGVDSSRLKQATREIVGIEIEGQMIGYHNSSMTPLVSTLKTKDGKSVFPVISGEVDFSDSELQDEFLEVEKTQLGAIVSRTRTLGGEISKEQRIGTTGEKDTGASILPATALAQLVESYCFGKKSVESYNVLIDDIEIAHNFGVLAGTALSIPVIIEHDKIEICGKIRVLETEKLAMREAQVSLNKDLRLIISDFSSAI